MQKCVEYSNDQAVRTVTCSTCDFSETCDTGITLQKMNSELDVQVINNESCQHFVPVLTH